MRYEISVLCYLKKHMFCIIYMGRVARLIHTRWSNCLLLYSIPHMYIVCLIYERVIRYKIRNLVVLNGGFTVKGQ